MPTHIQRFKLSVANAGDQEKDFWTGQAVSKYTARFGFGALNDEANAPLLAEIRQAVNDEVKPRHLANVEAMMKAGGTQVMLCPFVAAVLTFILPLNAIVLCYTVDCGHANAQHRGLCLDKRDRG